jgi:hypothetical protein
MAKGQSDVFETKVAVMKGLKHRQVRLMAFLHRVTNVGDIFVTKLDELD